MEIECQKYDILLRMSYFDIIMRNKIEWESCERFLIRKYGENVMIGSWKRKWSDEYWKKLEWKGTE